jgi:hypothetical protein
LLNVCFLVSTQLCRVGCVLGQLTKLLYGVTVLRTKPELVDKRAVCRASNVVSGDVSSHVFLSTQFPVLWWLELFSSGLEISVSALVIILANGASCFGSPYLLDSPNYTGLVGTEQAE